MDPPLGLTDGRPAGAARRWRPREALLLLFTDGISEARNRFDVRLGEQPVLDIVREHRDEAPAEILERVFAALQAYTGDVARRDDLALVLVRS
jgi:serine phosphatase RsbU (regulator of sigma subunit)